MITAALFLPPFPSVDSPTLATDPPAPPPPLPPAACTSSQQAANGCTHVSGLEIRWLKLSHLNLSHLTQILVCTTLKGGGILAKVAWSHLGLPLMSSTVLLRVKSHASYWKFSLPSLNSHVVRLFSIKKLPFCNLDITALQGLLQSFNTDFSTRNNQTCSLEGVFLGQQIGEYPLLPARKLLFLVLNCSKCLFVLQQLEIGFIYIRKRHFSFESVLM